MFKAIIVTSALFLQAILCLAQDEDADAEYARCLGLVNTERYQEAVGPLDKLVRAYPDELAYRHSRAVCFFNLKDFKKAAADYRVLYAFASENSEYAFQAGNAYEQMDSLTLALKYYTKAIKQNPEEFIYFFKRGTVYLKEQQWKLAIDDFNATLKLNDEYDNALHNRGIAHYKIGLKEKACNDWCAALLKGNPYSAKHLEKNCERYPAPCLLKNK